MSAGSFGYLGRRLQRLYRDPENGLILGVCAGLADYFELNLLLVRGVALAGLLVFTIPTGLVYLVAAILLRDRPLMARDRRREREFWRRGGSAEGGGL